LTHLLDQHETLGVGDNLGGVKGLLKVGKELLLVAGEVWRWTGDLLGSTSTLALERRQATGEDGLSDKGDWHTQVESVDGGPLAGTLLTSSVQDLLEERLTIVVVEVHDVAGDLNEERVKDTLVPLGESVSHLLVGHTETTLHDVIGLLE